MKNKLFKLILFFSFALLIYNADHNSVKEKVIEKVPEKKKISKYVHLKKHFKWLTPYKYKFIQHQSKLKNIPIEYICALIQVESQGYNVISKKNRNGTRDYGVMQINQIHSPKNPRKLLNFEYNIIKGTDYIKYSMKKSLQRFGKITIGKISMLYNGGVNVNPRYYKNWKYVRKIIALYKKARKEPKSKN